MNIETKNMSNIERANILRAAATIVDELFTSQNTVTRLLAMAQQFEDAAGVARAKQATAGYPPFEAPPNSVWESNKTGARIVVRCYTDSGRSVKANTLVDGLPPMFGTFPIEHLRDNFKKVSA